MPRWLCAKHSPAKSKALCVSVICCGSVAWWAICGVSKNKIVWRRYMGWINKCLTQKNYLVYSRINGILIPPTPPSSSSSSSSYFHSNPEPCCTENEKGPSIIEAWLHTYYYCSIIALAYAVSSSLCLYLDVLLLILGVMIMLLVPCERNNTLFVRHFTCLFVCHQT